MGEKAIGIEGPGRPRRRWLNWLGAAIGLGLLGLLAWRLDWRQFADVLGSARPEFVFATFLAITLEQVIRGWKWRQILTPVCGCRTSHLFGATMAGYLANLLVPLGLSPFVRSWLIARKQKLSMSCVLATVAIDRLVDGLVFAGIVIVVVLAVVIPDPNGNIGLGLLLGAGGSAAAIVAVLVLLVHHKRRSASGIGFFLALVDRLPTRFASRARSIAITFADGIVWPREHWRGVAIVLASIVIKLIAASHLFWAGLAFGVVLDPLVYLALLAILGFIVILAHMARVPAGFVVGAVFSLGLFGVGDATALAMVSVVMAANMLAVAVFGGWGLWVHGVGLGDLGRWKVAADADP
ncbi:lysylphosphatidylglycerol synthase transmembrane domain-containing protein [Roseovarius nitratireducens]|uniref:lysylphosphatidylglycerol synthase transmembrane domain-containing protein n=1 Tax=Roseovarius nitratireducens TaxID=2044597 RepID=UPI000CE242AA|nr:lysylphosphatidylglycerol synthase transmembrane domain-containing protein [Roseovarius nitratireducens]